MCVVPFKVSLRNKGGRYSVDDVNFSFIKKLYIVLGSFISFWLIKKVYTAIVSIKRDLQIIKFCSVNKSCQLKSMNKFVFSCQLQFKSKCGFIYRLTS